MQVTVLVRLADNYTKSKGFIPSARGFSAKFIVNMIKMKHPVKGSELSFQ